jgi:hypothetical protein
VQASNQRVPDVRTADAEKAANFLVDEEHVIEGIVPTSTSPLRTHMERQLRRERESEKKRCGRGRYAMASRVPFSMMRSKDSSGKSICRASISRTEAHIIAHILSNVDYGSMHGRIAQQRRFAHWNVGERREANLDLMASMTTSCKRCA